ncbi:hypothetical protein MOMMJLID_CDS0029 [Arthrobacter phage 1191A]|nr:hypothetical protein MOMMJLID_CDS0029 [Arthrobacter phage 1191A]
MLLFAYPKRSFALHFQSTLKRIPMMQKSTLCIKNPRRT